MVGALVLGAIAVLVVAFAWITDRPEKPTHIAGNGKVDTRPGHKPTELEK
ncbi:MAG: hypothetical protein WC718_04295 [Phycisphaerales bacterium]|jgi:hypothetical protein